MTTSGGIITDDLVNEAVAAIVRDQALRATPYAGVHAEADPEAVRRLMNGTSPYSVGPKAYLGPAFARNLPQSNAAGAASLAKDTVLGFFTGLFNDLKNKLGKPVLIGGAVLAGVLVLASTSKRKR